MMLPTVQPVEEVAQTRGKEEVVAHMRPKRSSSSVLVLPSVLLLAVGAIVALAMVALSAGPSSGKVKGGCEDLEGTCTGGASAPGTGTGGGGGRFVGDRRGGQNRNHRG